MTMPPASRLNDLLTPLLLAIMLLLLAWLSSRYQLQWDWTRHGSNSLSETSIALLQRTQGPLQITAYMPDLPTLRSTVSGFIARYQRHKPDLTLRFVDPMQQPQEARRQDIRFSFELLLAYQGRQERLQKLNEQQLTSAIQRLQQTHTRWVAGLTGHGERSLMGIANHDLGDFGLALARLGYPVVELDLVASPEPPDNTALLVIASPLKSLLAGELQQLRRYLQQGKQLLLLVDPDNPSSQQPLLDLFGIEQLPGIIVDANVQALGIDTPTVAHVSRYPQHPALAGFNMITLYPQASALVAAKGNEWQITPLLQTLAKSWNETGALKGEIQRDPLRNEQAGPLTIGYALNRTQTGREQRIVVIGDGDFLSNSSLGNVGNLDLGLALVRWLTSDDRMIGIPPREPLDRELHLSPLAKGLIWLCSLILLPLLLGISGGIITWRRNRA